MRRRKSELDKELADQSKLLRLWRRWHRGQLELARAGPHGVIVERVVGFLKHMELRSAPALLVLLRDYDWRYVDADTRFTLLHEIDRSIGALRERSGLPVIDDALPHERVTGFLAIRTLLGAQEKHAGDSPAKRQT